MVWIPEGKTTRLSEVLETKKTLSVNVVTVVLVIFPVKDKLPHWKSGWNRFSLLFKETGKNANKQLGALEIYIWFSITIFCSSVVENVGHMAHIYFSFPGLAIVLFRQLIQIEIL